MDSEDDTRPAPAIFPRKVIARGLARDVGTPVVIYYVLHLNGVSDWLALLAATGVAGSRVVWEPPRPSSTASHVAVVGRSPDRLYRAADAGL